MLAYLYATASFAQGVAAPFNKGVNLTNWFQESDVRTIQLYKYPPRTFDQIKSLGCDVVRLPINLHPMCGPAPDFTVPPLLFQFLDSVSNWAAEAGGQLIFDNHTVVLVEFFDTLY